MHSFNEHLVGPYWTVDTSAGSLGSQILVVGGLSVGGETESQPPNFRPGEKCCIRREQGLLRSTWEQCL